MKTSKKAKVVDMGQKADKLVNIMPKITKPKIDKSTMWPDWLYHKDTPEKSLITLHHTAGHGGPEALNYLRTRSSQTMREKGYSVGTAYAIDATRGIFQAFDDKYSAYHTGSGSAYNDFRSVAIEIDNVGFLHKRGNKYIDMYGYDVGKLGGFKKVTVYDNKTPWRGHRYFEAYYDKQIDELIQLLEDIFKRYPTIPRKIPADFFPEKPFSAYKRNNFKGILSHVHFLPAGMKWDTSIALKPYMEKLIDTLNLEVV